MKERLQVRMKKVTISALFALGVLWALTAVSIVPKLFADPVFDSCTLSSTAGLLTLLLTVATAITCGAAGWQMMKR